MNNKWITNDESKIAGRFRCYWNSKTWNKKQEGGFPGALLPPLVIKGISGRGVRRPRRGRMGENF